MCNNRVFKILIAMSALLISGCKNKEEPTPVIPEPEDDTSIYIDVEAGSFYNPKDYDLKFKYNDTFFEGSAKTFNKNLALLSLGHAFTSGFKSTSLAFIDDIGFNEVDSSHYIVPSGVDTVAFSIAKKEINDFVVVGVFIRSINYGVEWGNNLTIGKEDDHLGYTLRANEVKEALESYIASKCENENLKLWISGYSRGGGISNLLASLILRDNKYNVSQDDMFVYTFAAPNAVCDENFVAYENVHNIINSGDFVTNIPPNSFGLRRCGIDYDIYDTNVASIMHEFDAGINISDFVTIPNPEAEDIVNEPQLVKYLLSEITKEIQKETASAQTRELYVENYGSSISNMVVLMFRLSNTSLSSMMEELGQLGYSEILRFLYDDTGERLKDFLTPYLDKDGIDYEENLLLEDCATIIKAVMNVLFKPIMLAINEKFTNNFIRLISMHFPDTYYGLFLNYIK